MAPFKATGERQEGSRVMSREMALARLAVS
jgi:hypothetical protein